MTTLTPPAPSPSGEALPPDRDGVPAPARRRRPGRSSPPRRLARIGSRVRQIDPATWAVAIAGFTLGLWAMHAGVADLLAGGTATVLAVSRLAGLSAALAALGGLVLTSRPRWLERRAGLDRLLGWHRLTGITAAFALLVHVLTALVAAGGGVSAAWQALAGLVTGADWYVAALVAALLFATVSLTSWRRIRRRLSYETWHALHVVGYLAVALAFPHQLFDGSTFLGSPAARWWWIGLYLATAAIVVQARLGGIVRSVVRPRTELARVIPEAPGVASLVVTGPGVDALGARPGQYVSVRALTSDLWWQAHPYSLSATPRPGALRLTVKALGDWSAQALALTPGTRLLLEGPYGTMSIEAAGARPVLLVGAGVGLAPMRALLEAASAHHRPVVLARGRTVDELPLAAELGQLAAERGGALLPVIGPRSLYPDGNPFTAGALVANVPDLRHRVAFLCLPAGLHEQVRRELLAAGLAADSIHTDTFTW